MRQTNVQHFDASLLCIQRLVLGRFMRKFCGRITRFARPSVCLCDYSVWAGNSKTKGIEKSALV